MPSLSFVGGEGRFGVRTCRCASHGWRRHSFRPIRRSKDTDGEDNCLEQDIHASIKQRKEVRLLKLHVVCHLLRKHILLDSKAIHAALPTSVPAPPSRLQSQLFILEKFLSILTLVSHSFQHQSDRCPSSRNNPNTNITPSVSTAGTTLAESSQRNGG